MKFKMYYKKTPDWTQQKGNIKIKNFNFDKFLNSNFPDRKVSLKQLKETMPPKAFKEFLKQTNTIYIGVNDKEDVF